MQTIVTALIVFAGGGALVQIAMISEPGFTTSFLLLLGWVLWGGSCLVLLSMGATALARRLR